LVLVSALALVSQLVLVSVLPVSHRTS